uniref:Methyltransferase domain-containing protein n=1 Tax=Magnetococcus massalia (strain MO-1) TaxID=451514 RepID=A0A1S7LK80_MAGMO|nr:Conserved protein of unknown function [Candidatus Magnetococcus massalia]
MEDIMQNGTINTIPSEQINRCISYDKSGYVFFWNNCVYRAIYKDHAKQIRALFQCGLIEELIEKGLFPLTTITEYKTTDCDFVLHHDKIPVQTLPSEWSFLMLKDAALVILKINKIAKHFGYQTIDAHGFNILFHHGKPVFIDIGSFVEIHNDFNCDKTGWRPYGEFIRSFYTPLKIWSNGDSYFARQALYGFQLPMFNYWRYRYCFFRLLPVEWLRKFEFLYYRYKALNSSPMNKFKRLISVSKTREKIGDFVVWLAKHKLLLFSSVNLERLSQKTEHIKLPNISSAWGDYHIDSTITSRHRYILSAIDKYNIKTVLDIAGNAGLLADLICEYCKVDHVICADYDENAIDALYKRIRSNQTNITPVMLDFRASVVDTRFPPPQERLKSDLVVAMALTHHLILAQGLTLDFIMAQLRSFSEKYVFVEFMPHGLYSSKFDKLPLVPSWYTLDWFRAGFEKYFILLHEENLEDNRVLLIGKIIK